MRKSVRTVIYFSIFCGIHIAGVCQDNVQRHKLARSLAETFEQGRHKESYSISRKLATLYLEYGDTLSYLNYENKAIGYYSNFQPDSALILQSDLIKEFSSLKKKDTQMLQVLLEQYSKLSASCEKNAYESINTLRNVMNVPTNKDSAYLSIYNKTIGAILSRNNYHIESLESYAKSFELSNKKDRSTLIQIGLSLYTLQEYGLAFDAFVFSLNKSLREPGAIELANIFNHIGNCLFKFNNFQQAVFFYKLSLEKRLVVSGITSNLPIVYQNLGNAYQYIDLNESYKNYRLAIESCQVFHRNDNELLGNAYNNLGNYYNITNQVDSAIYYYEVGLEYRRKLATEESRFYIHQSLYNLAESYYKKGAFNKSISYADSAINTINQLAKQGFTIRGSYSTANIHFDKYTSHLILARSHFKKFQTSNQLTDLKSSYNEHAIAIKALSLGQEALVDEQSKLIRSRDKRYSIMEAVNIQFTLDSLSGEKQPDLVFELFREYHNSQLEDLHHQRLKQSRTLRSIFINKVVSDLKTIDTEDPSASKEVINALSSNYSIEAELNDIIKKYKEASAQQGIPRADYYLHDLQEIDSSEKIILFLVNDVSDQIQFFSLRNGKSAYGTLGSSKEMENHINILHTNLIEYNFQDITIALRTISKTFSNIFEMKNSRVSQLYLIPDKFLWKLPFDALTIDDSVDRKYLIEEKNIAMQVSLAFLLKNRATAIKQEKENHRIRTWAGLAPVYFSEGNSNISDLPASKFEVLAIQKILKYNYLTKVLVGDQASENNLRQTGNIDMLHIASHSLKDTLSMHQGFSIRDGKKTKSISYYDIIDYNINPQRIFLNICSAIDSNYIEGEGPMNLNRAFILNGTNQIVYTQRPVLDNFAALFAQKFYENLISTNDYHSSLSKTKLYFINSPTFNHPVFWSNYQIISSN